MSTPLESPDQGGLATLDRELEELIREENIEPGDHERFSHYVKKDKILESAITGKPVRALCGKKWTPGRDPEKYPVCPTCKQIYESLNKRDCAAPDPGRSSDSGRVDVDGGQRRV